MPSAGGGPGWALAVCRFEAGDPSAMLETMRDLGDDELGWAIPVERCFNWEILALAELALGRRDAAARVCRSSGSRRRDARTCTLPAAVAARTRAAVLLATGDAPAAARLAESRSLGHAPPARGSRRRSRAACSVAHWRRPATAPQPSSSCERPSASSTRAARCARATRSGASCAGSARAASRAARRGGESGVASLTKRELEIAVS